MPPQSTVSIPFSRDADFVNRGDILDQISQRHSERGGRVALVGLGGVGKSQLAIEFVYRVAETHSDIWVFWVYAGTQARVEEGFKMIADTVKLDGRDKPNADIPLLVQIWLSNEQNGRWIVVLDSADDGEVLYSASEGGYRRPLASYLPQSRNGFIIVTTRNKELALKVTGSRKFMIDVEPMTPGDALQLLERKLGSFSARDVAVDLVKALDCVPLAISQAAAYIQAREPRASVEKYVAHLRGSEQQRTKLLEHDAGDLRRDGGASNAILTTWQLSFEHIRQKRPSAAHLLSLMSFFDPQSIPESALRPSKGIYHRRPASGQAEGFERDSDNDDEFEDDVAILRDYCLVTFNKEDDDFKLHGLVQLSTRKWLEVHGQQEILKQEFILRMAAMFPTWDYENWTACQKLFIHVQLAFDYRPAEGTVIEWASLIYRGGRYAYKQGRYNIAERMVNEAREVQSKALGREHPKTLSSMKHFADILRMQGRWAEAEKLYLQVLEIRKAKLGNNHRKTLSTMGNLASTYQRQGRWEEAEQLELQVLEASKAKLGDHHTETLASLGNLAAIYRHQRRLDESEKLQLQVLEARKAMHGDDHPYTLTSTGNLASIYRHQGRLEEAEKLELQVLEARNAKLGNDHPITLRGMGNLASVYRRQRRLEESEQLELQVLEARKAKLGNDHPDTLISLGKLASTYRHQGRLEEAEKLELQVLEAKMDKLGIGNPRTLGTTQSLAHTWDDAGSG
jgi:tetratricopeptide (TPR) repeat protein